MSKTLPNVEFRISRQRISPAARKWLAKKRDFLSKAWQKEGLRILGSIEEHCGFDFPAKTISEGMVVILFQRKNRKELGDMDESKPLECNLYMSKSDTWRNIKTPLVHELIHCLMWQKFYFDQRTGMPTFFADIFADELMACIAECLVLGRKLSYRTCGKAIGYALEEATTRLSETGQCEQLVRALMEFIEEYRLKMKNKESNILKERENILARLPSLVPEAID